MRVPAYLAIILTLTIAAPLQAADDGSDVKSRGFLKEDWTMKRLTPEEKAVASYEDGIKHRDKAAKYEQKAVDETNEKKFAKLQKKVAKEYKRAIYDYEKAIGHYQRFYQAHNSLGYALRKAGRYDESLAAYDVALDINPVFDEAIEYRGETYLGLNRIGEAKEAYMDLFQNDRALADQLMSAMIAWVAARRDHADGMDTAVVEQFAEWVEQRSELASYVQPMDDAVQNRWAESR